MKKTIIFFLLTLFCVQINAQQTYQLSEADGEVVCTGVEQMKKSDVNTFVNSLLWAIDKCPKLKDDIAECDMDKLKFTTKLFFTSKKDEKQGYECDLTVQVASQQLFFLFNNIYSTSTGILGKRTPFEKLNPKKKEKHKEYYNEFTKLLNSELGGLIKFIGENDVPALKNWNKVKNGIVEKGMSEVECTLVMGKPINISKNGQRVQWMYSTSAYLFFENGLLKTVLK